MKIMISGSHGLVGTALRDDLIKEGHEVIRLSRNFDELSQTDGVDVVVHLAGESIAEGRWNAGKKKRIEESRVLGTRNLARLIATNPNKPTVFISASAIGYYGDRGTEILNEESRVGEGFLPAVCEKWEKATESVEQLGIRTVHLRTGIVLSEKGGALKKMLPPFKMGGGGRLGNGKQFMSWISMDDMVASIRFLIETTTASGPFNLVSPEPVTNDDFTKALGAALRRPTFMPLPAFAAKILFGEMAEALLLSSARVHPTKLVEAGYAFRHARLKSALEDILK